MPKTTSGIARRLKDPRCPVEILREYARLGWEDAVAANPSCPPDILEEIVDRICHPGLRLTFVHFRAVEAVLARDDVPAGILEKLSYHDNDWIRWLVHRKQPEVFAGREYDAVYSYECHKIDIPPDKIRELYRSRDTDWKVQLLRHKNCPQDLIDEVLEKSSNTKLLAAAIEGRRLPKELLLKAYRRVCKKNTKNANIYLQHFINHPDCPDEVLIDVAMRGDWLSGKAIAVLKQRGIEVGRGQCGGATNK